MAQGSIPACAGEPADKQIALLKQRVYPRVCGGTRIAIQRAALGLGLSPRVRGNPAHAGHDVEGEGSIPACAGEPASGTRSTSRSQVYPRVCGGTAPSTLAGGISPGLSPRVRGNL